MLSIGLIRLRWQWKKTCIMILGIRMRLIVESYQLSISLLRLCHRCLFLYLTPKGLTRKGRGTLVIKVLSGVLHITTPKQCALYKVAIYIYNFVHPHLLYKVDCYTNLISSSAIAITGKKFYNISK